MFGSYAYTDTRPRIDVGGALDAFTTGASSLIHAAYQRELLDAQAVRLETGITGLSAEEASGQVGRTRTLLGAGRGTTLPPVSPSTAAQPPGASGSIAPPSTAKHTPQVIMKPGAAKPAAPAAGSSKDTSNSGDDFTDDELADAWNAGMRTDATIRKYVLANRAAKTRAPVSSVRPD